MSSNEEDTIKSIQATIRGNLARKKYGVKQLETSDMVSYPPFLIGNDKPLSSKDLKPYQIMTPFVFVGTSMFRSIDFACKMAGQSIIPKVIIVDNSKEVFRSWLELKRFFAETKLTNYDDYLEADEGILNFILENLSHTTQGENVYKYFKDFFKVCDFEYVKKVVFATAVVRQDWCHEDTFIKIKNIYGDMPIVAYPSNIISCLKKNEEQIHVLKCLALLNPTLCIYSNLDGLLKKPTQTYVLTEFNPKTIAETLNLVDDVQQEFTEKKLTTNL